jgi:hypothetical protein
VLNAGQSFQEIAVHHVDATYFPKQVPQINESLGQNNSYRHRCMEMPVKNSNNNFFYYVVTQKSLATLSQHHVKTKKPIFKRKLSASARHCTPLVRQI